MRAFTLLVFLIVLLSGCRSIEGRYRETFVSGDSAIYRFNKDRTFTYTNDDVIGSGTYNVRFGKLTLKYGKTEYPACSSRCEVRDTVLRGKNVCEKNICVRVFDEHNYPLPGVLVEIEEINYMRGSTDLDGNFLFRCLSEQQDTFWVAIRAASWGYCDARQMVVLKDSKLVQIWLTVHPSLTIDRIDSGYVDKSGLRCDRNGSLRLIQRYWGRDWPDDALKPKRKLFKEVRVLEKQDSL